MTTKTWFVDVILPLPLPFLYTYGISAIESKSLRPGCRVTVQFGKRKYYTAIVKKIHSNKPADYDVKNILSVLDHNPVINTIQLQFWEWLADYYLCNLGEVFKAALPPGMKLESETKIFQVAVDFQDYSLTRTEEVILDALNKTNGLSLKQLNDISDRKDVLPVVKSMVEKGMVDIEEQLIEKYKPKIKKYVSLTVRDTNEKILNGIITKLERSPKQLNVFLKYIELSGIEPGNKTKEIEKSELLKKSGKSPSVLNSLIKKGILEIIERETGRLNDENTEVDNISVLNRSQDMALHKIKELFNYKDILLLHGVTSSGKTEIYFHLINEQLENNKQVLYLLPEIALTAQIINRLKSVFGNKVGIYHSRFSNAERQEIYTNILGQLKPNQTRYQIILGARSSVFLPFDNLGLIIIDEEHENSYKQFDPAPRYHARDAAIVLAKLHNAKVLLGSATPSLESYHNALSGKYDLVELNERFLNLEMPEIKVVDLISSRKRKEMKSHFSNLLINSISAALENKEQIILFQNRRGFSPYLECDDCGWIPVCKNCDVSLTYHKKFNKLLCHYCGYTISNPKTCDSCGSAVILSKGFGTEKIEDEIGIMFPQAKIARLDMDNARTRNSYTRIIYGFETGEIDILVGTQMVSKGLDFDNVQVVGILNADNMLNYPDFRSYERSYQLMAQVSGRAGRKNGRGIVIIQTSDPKNPVITSVVNNNFKQMFTDQISERESFKYPPFYRLISLVIKHKNITVLNPASEDLARNLRILYDKRVIGPEFPVISRIQNWHLKHILIKFEKDSTLSAKKNALRKIIEDFLKNKKYSGIQININVDPM